jgi:hypothetical protein
MADKLIIGNAFTDITEARARAKVLRDAGNEVVILGPARRAFVEGGVSGAYQWPAAAAEDRYLVIATNSKIETPPKAGA